VFKNDIDHLFVFLWIFMVIFGICFAVGYGFVRHHLRYYFRIFITFVAWTFFFEKLLFSFQDDLVSTCLCYLKRETCVFFSIRRSLFISSLS